MGQKRDRSEILSGYSLRKRPRKAPPDPISGPGNERLATLTGSEDDKYSHAKGVTEDDLCPVCQQLLYKPVVTICRHYLCQACMMQWAEISTSSQMAILDINEEITPPVSNSALDLEVNCPLCRTQTSATNDRQRAQSLSRRYKTEYARRKVEDDADTEAARRGTASSVQTLTVHIGNRHRLVTDNTSNQIEDKRHNCVFFVKLSRTDIIEEIQVQLPPTFRPSRIIRTRPPFEIERNVHSSFAVCANIILKAGYSWLSSDAVDSPDGAINGLLPLDWMIDLTGHQGRGSMGRVHLKVMKEGANSGADDTQDHDHEDRELRRDRNAWERMVREYQRDGLWNPGDSEDD